MYTRGPPPPTVRSAPRELRLHRRGRQRVHVGYAAHCAGTGGATETNGCDSGSAPLGTKVDFVEGGSLVTSDEKVGTGTLVYSSWLAMQQAGTTDTNACDYNDFALVKVELSFVDDVNPSIPFWGGPVGSTATAPPPARPVILRQLEHFAAASSRCSAKQGTSLGTGDGWTHSATE